MRFTTTTLVFLHLFLLQVLCASSPARFIRIQRSKQPTALERLNAAAEKLLQDCKIKNTLAERQFTNTLPNLLFRRYDVHAVLGANGGVDRIFISLKPGHLPGTDTEGLARELEEAGKLTSYEQAEFLAKLVLPRVRFMDYAQKEGKLTPELLRKVAEAEAGAGLSPSHTGGLIGKLFRSGVR
jgi:hypothetical protein